MRDSSSGVGSKITRGAKTLLEKAILGDDIFWLSRVLNATSTDTVRNCLCQRWVRLAIVFVTTPPFFVFAILCDPVQPNTQAGHRGRGSVRVPQCAATRLNALGLGQLLAPKSSFASRGCRAELEEIRLFSELVASILAVCMTCRILRGPENLHRLNGCVGDLCRFVVVRHD
jgi:hypothetical protein